MRKLEIDVRGLSCPQPVLKAKQAMMLEDVTAIDLIVDDETSKENIMRFVEGKGWKIVENKKEGSVVLLEITR